MASLKLAKGYCVMCLLRRSVLMLILIACAWTSPATAANDFILVIDHSGSMGKWDPKDIRLDAATMVVDAADDDDRVAAVVFGNGASNIVELTEITANPDVKATICERILKDPKIDRQGTDIIAALTLAQAQALKAARTGGKAEVLLLTDGKMDAFGPPGTRWSRKNSRARYENEYAELNSVLLPLVAKKIPVHCIALGKKADTKFLRTISSTTDGGYFAVNDSKELPEVYLKILCAGKGMVSVESSEFYVWPDSKEINIVLFKSRPGKKGAKFTSIQGGKSEYLTDSETYVAGRREDPPRFYDFVRVRQPVDGKWAVQTKKKGDLQIHAMQSVPFSFEILSPSGGKERVGSDVQFVAKVAAKSGAKRGILAKLLPDTTVEVALQQPDGTVVKSRLLHKIVEDSGMFSGKIAALQQGHHVAEFTGKFTSEGQTPWQTSLRRSFYAGPSDFELVITTPENGSTVESPFHKLTVVGKLKKTDVECKSLTLSPRATITAEISDSKDALVYRTSWNFKERGLSQLLLDGPRGKAPVLEPGTYELVLSAKDPKHTVKKGLCSLVIGPWPAPDLSGISGTIEPPAEAGFLAGQTGEIVVCVNQRTGEALGIGSNLGNGWKVRQVNYHIERKDPLGKALIADGFLLSKPTATTRADVPAPIRCSGSCEFLGNAILSLALDPDGKELATTNAVVQLKPLVLDISERVEIAPDVGSLQIKDLNKKAVATFEVRSWAPSPTELSPGVSKARLRQNELPLPENWLHLRGSVRPSLGHPATLTVEARVPENEQKALKFGAYRALITLSGQSKPTRLLTQAELVLNIPVIWPDKRDFEIKHSLPGTLPVESNLMIYDNVLSKWGKTQNMAYATRLHHKPDDTMVATGSNVGQSFVVTKLVWAAPEPDFRRCVEEGAENAAYAVGSLWDTGTVELKLKVSELTLAVKIDPSVTKTYTDITAVHKIRVTQ